MSRQSQLGNMGQQNEPAVNKVTHDGRIRLSGMEWAWGRHMIIMERDGNIVLQPVKVDN